MPVRKKSNQNSTKDEKLSCEDQLEAVLAKMFHKDKMSLCDIRQTIDRILSKPESEGGFVDDSSIGKAKEWAKCFIQDLEEYFNNDEDEYNNRSDGNLAYQHRSALEEHLHF